MSSKNHVKFRKDSSPTSGSSTASSHRRSDSGVGSLSDHGSRAAYSDRAFTPSDYEPQRYNISALQDALGAAHESRDRWKAKAQDLDNDLKDTRKDLKEIEARWSALVDRNELIEGEKKKLHSEKKSLAEENASLRDQIATLQAALEKAEKKSKRQQADSPPSMSGAIPAEAPKLRRSPSKREKEKANEAEQAQKEKARLSRRFERSDESSDGNSTSTAKSHRSRRASYVEPLGPPAARPTIGQVPPSPTRHYSHYTTSPQYPPQYPNIREPAVSNLPRSIHPKVSYVYEEPKAWEGSRR